MTDESHVEIAIDGPTTAERVEPNEDQPMVQAIADDTDWFLAIQIELAERGLEQDLVLDIGGSHLSGTLIGGWRYFDEMARPWRREGQDPAGIALLYESYRDNYESPDRRESYPPLGERSLGFIHLKNAKWLTADGPSLPGNGTLWRGKLSSVDGYWIGSLSVSRS